MRDKTLLSLLQKESVDRFFKINYLWIDSCEVKKFYKISICTNCMGRAEDIKNTLEKNILDNISYPYLEFVLLNYNSNDDLDDWVKSYMIKYIDKGILNYYKTIEPKYYSMTHSRNIEFKAATGDIVNNVDADQYTNEGFVSKINMLANYKNSKVVFVKSHQKNRGRAGLFKSDFLELGGYNEELQDYGFDDEDLILRAYHSGYTIMKFGGEYMRLVDNHNRHPVINFKEKNWKYTQRRNCLISLIGLKHKRFIANNGEWGKAKLIKNFKEEIKI